jgi:hypothetical protein
VRVQHTSRTHAGGADVVDAQRRVGFRKPALDTWRAELAQGERTPTTFDALWGAASEEAAALDAASLGQYTAARRHLKNSGVILDDAICGRS